MLEPGLSKSAIPTPRLCVQLENMERNIASMAATMATAGMDWRPHAKSHRSPRLAEKLLKAGAIGVTCATLDEAEQMTRGGIGDVLLANLTVGPDKVERLARSCSTSDPVIAIDHFAQVGPISKACEELDVECRAIVEVDIGMNRVGIRPGTDAHDLAVAVDRSPGLRLSGLMGYEGHLLTVADLDEKAERIEAAMSTLLQTRDRFLDAGLECSIVSAGGTGSYQFTTRHRGITEIQAGGGIFGDPFYTNCCQVEGLESALTVVATVVSRPSRDRAIVDAGRKTLNGELHMPLVKDRPDAEVVRLSAEHGVLQLGDDSRDLRIGDRLELIVGYSDFTNVLHGDILAFRGETLEEIWPIGGRYRET